MVRICPVQGRISKGNNKNVHTSFRNIFKYVKTTLRASIKDIRFKECYREHHPFGLSVAQYISLNNMILKKTNAHHCEGETVCIADVQTKTSIAVS